MLNMLTNISNILLSVNVNKELEGFKNNINDVLNIVIGLMVFVGVISIGFELFIHRKNAEQRAQSLGSIIWIGIGCLIISLALTIAKIFITF